jgi:hypothetical protein
MKRHLASEPFWRRRSIEEELYAIDAFALFVARVKEELWKKQIRRATYKTPHPSQRNSTPNLKETTWRWRAAGPELGVGASSGEYLQIRVFFFQLKFNNGKHRRRRPASKPSNQWCFNQKCRFENDNDSPQLGLQGCRTLLRLLCRVMERNVYLRLQRKTRLWKYNKNIPRTSVHPGGLRLDQLVKRWRRRRHVIAAGAAAMENRLNSVLEYASGNSGLSSYPCIQLARGRGRGWWWEMQQFDDREFKLQSLIVIPN